MTFKSGKSLPMWYVSQDATERSRTFPGIANAMAAQWGTLPVLESR